MQPQAKNTWNHQTLQEEREDSPPEPLEAVHLLPTL